MRNEAEFFAGELRNNAPKLDLHGLMPDEAGNRIDQFLYQNFEASELSVQVIFGIGKGVLKRTTMNFLDNHPLVEKVIDKGGSCIVILSSKNY